MDPADVARSYDAVADAYADRFRGELAHKPFDRAWLDRLVDLARGLGPICDLGCGPGHVAAYLRSRGADAFGADLSDEMVRVARRLNPGIRFERQDMLALTLPERSLGAVAAFYAIVHFSLDQAERAFAEVGRVLVPGGHLLVAFHVGDETRHVDELLGRRVSLDFRFFAVDDVLARLEAAGLAIAEVTLRYPYPDVEVATRRAYVLARKPG
jgi:SAM-dependent methyltransferase